MGKTLKPRKKPLNIVKHHIHFEIREVFPQTDPQAFKDLTILNDSLFDSDGEPPKLLKGWWWIAYVGDQPIGFCGLSPAKSRRTWGYLNRSGVLKKFRGRGLQSKFIQIRLDRCRETGYKAAIVATYDNPYSGNNLIDAGFRMYMPDRKWLCYGAIYWKLELEKASGAAT